VRRNDGAPGIDKFTLGAVEEYGIDRFLAEIETKLREGRYRPLPARQVLIPKPGAPGQARPLGIATVISYCPSCNRVLGSFQGCGLCWWNG
jgi:RNA-directed DNA polymerase